MSLNSPIAEDMWPAASRCPDITERLSDLAGQWPDLEANSLWSVAIALAAKAQSMGEDAAANEGELPYHNRDHVEDVLRALALLFTYAPTPLSVDKRAMLIVAMLAHDFGHPGRPNHHAYELEWQAWHAAKTLLDGQSTTVRRGILQLILSTDPASYARLGRAGSPMHRHLAQMAVEADLFASIQPQRGFYLGFQLSREMAPHDPSLAAKLQTLDGRMRFLQHCRVLSPPARALGLDRLVRAQINLIAQLPKAARTRPWSADWGREYAAQVAALMVC